jgi:hypothetical protein
LRRQVVEDILRFYGRHNVLYEGVAVACSALVEDTVAESVIVEAADADVEATEINAEHDRVGSVSENDASTTEDDVIERGIVFISDDREVSTQDAQPVERENATEGALQPQFLVRHSSQFAQPDSTILAWMVSPLIPLWTRTYGGAATRACFV